MGTSCLPSPLVSSLRQGQGRPLSSGFTPHSLGLPSLDTKFRRLCIERRAHNAPSSSGCEAECRVHSTAARRRQPKRRAGFVTCSADNGRGGGQRTTAQIDSEAKIRSEVIAPFRTIRIFAYIAFMASAGVGGLIALTRVIGTLNGAPNAEPLVETLKGLGIDVAAFALFAYLYRIDTQAQTRSVARITREEKLSGLRLELSNKRVVSVGQLRGIRRLLIVAGSGNHIENALQQAEPVKNELVERGVLVVPLYTSGSAPAESASSSEGGKDGTTTVGTQAVDTNKVFRAAPIYTSEWGNWLSEQKKLANVSDDKPVYISLRMDGRVRGSGVGTPPWRIIAAQLPPLKGIWAGALDGMDGRV